MADIADSIDITTDLNGQSADAVPFHDGLTEHRQGDVPQVLPEEKGDEKPAPSLRDLLSDAFKGNTPPVEGETKPVGTDTIPHSDATQAPPELVKVGDRWHNKDGTFASKEQIDAFNAGVAAPGVSEGSAPPAWAQSLTPLELQQYTSLPAETKAFLERTMEDVNQRTARFNEYDLIEQVIGPRRDAWAQGGSTPAVALQQLFALSDFAGRDPGEFVMWFADQHNLDLDALLDARELQMEAPDPRYQGLQQEIAQLRNAITGMTSQTTDQQLASNMNLVRSFSEQKDAAGNLAHPYFNEVAADIQRHVALIRQQQPFLAEGDVLKAAYDFATYSNSAVRAKIQEAEAKAIRDNAAAEAAKARQAGVSINGGPAGDAGQQPNNANRTLRDELVHAYNQSTLQ